MKRQQSIHEYVTKEGGTEKEFQNAYWDNYKPGIYLDYNTGKPLFSSLDKFDSGTGWPSFTKHLADADIREVKDTSLGMGGTEVCTEDSRLGHVFSDGLKETGGKRYCINSAALKFIAYENLEKEGYGEYKKLFVYEEAVLSGGCFWRVEHLLEQQEGIIEAVSGYSGGKMKNPSYEQVSTGTTGHAEAVFVIFDPEVISYIMILDIFWRLHDPTQMNKQGLDIGSHYRSAIFYMNKRQKKIAEESKNAFDKKEVFDKPAVTQIVKFESFYKAEDYHQDYVTNHPNYTCHSLRAE